MPGPMGTLTNSPVVDGGTTALCRTGVPGGCTGAEQRSHSDISIAEGQKIVAEAATWAGTPYVENGAKSEKGKGGDCSGSTNKIYAAAGFGYAYHATATFEAYARKSGMFRLLGKEEQPQPGDLLFFGHHMAIYAGFTGADPKGAAGKSSAKGVAAKPDPKVTPVTPVKTNAKGAKGKQTGDMWTATKPGGNPYETSKISYFGTPQVYRYQKVPMVGR